MLKRQIFYAAAAALAAFAGSPGMAGNPCRDTCSNGLMDLKIDARGRLKFRSIWPAAVNAAKLIL